MTIKQRITLCLQAHPEGVDDDELARILGLSARQQANMRCRELEQEGLVARRHVSGKIHNFWIGGTATSVTVAEEPTGTHWLSEGGSKPWFWEGNVQSAVIRYLASQNYLIRSVANTATKEQGKDIIAERDRRELWVSVKGYPKGTDKTRPSTEAGHWFKQVIFDIIEYRGESSGVELGVALPDFRRYRSLANKIAWFQTIAGFAYYWVQANGAVVVE